VVNDLLLPGDPLLPRALKLASEQEGAFEWVMDSARLWARREFVDREMRRVEGAKLIFDMDVRLRELRAHKVAVRVNEKHWEPDARVRDRYEPLPGSVVVDAAGEAVLTKLRHQIKVGLLDGDSCEGYIKLNCGFFGYFSGMMEIADVVELPECYRVRPWPVVAGYRASRSSA
jgi:hypothetical protein